MDRPLLGVSTSPDPDGCLDWYGVRVPWKELRDKGRRIADGIGPGAYVVDPSAGPEAFAALFAVAARAGTTLLWCRPEALGVPTTAIAPGLHRVDAPPGRPDGRPLWGVMTSGTSGRSALPIGYADSLELVALHYQAAVFEPSLGRSPAAFATCLPLQFSAALFMSVLPAVCSGRDLLVFRPDDWRPLTGIARAGVVCQAVPALAAAGVAGLPEPVDATGLVLLLGGGYLTATRVRALRERLREAVIGNIYGTAETGAMSIDWAPGESTHVGRPIPGKPVWIEQPGPDGVGLIATTGPDCRRFRWVPGEAFEDAGEVVTGTDRGHLDADGFLHLDGRVDEGTKLHGVLVYPRRVERHLLSLPGVADARVAVRLVGGAERLCARVIGSLSPEQVADGCAGLPEIERPTSIECVPERDALRAYTAHGKL